MTKRATIIFCIVLAAAFAVPVCIAVVKTWEPWTPATWLGFGVVGVFMLGLYLGEKGSRAR